MFERGPLSKTATLTVVSAVSVVIGVLTASVMWSERPNAPNSGGSPLAFGSSLDPVSENIFVELAKRIVPSVVNISTETVIQAPPLGVRPDDIFRWWPFGDPYGAPGQPGGPLEEEEEELPGPGFRRPPRATSLGTGFIIDQEGLILTNNHVVSGADEIKVQFTEEADEEPTPGEVVGRDPDLDLALIRVKTERKLVPLVFGDSDALQVGEYVIAVGQPFGRGHSVTHGIISAKDRRSPGLLARYLQTDAPINPGNSGGPLVNLRGEVIGINNAIDARANGIGFAIPVNVVKQVLPQLKEKGTVTRGYIGVLVNPLTAEVAEKIGAPKDIKAPFVVNVYPDTPSDEAGIEPYDVILEFNGQKIRNNEDLVQAVTAVPVGEEVQIKLLRSGKEMTVAIRVAERSTNLFAEQERIPKKKARGRIDTGMELETLVPKLARKLNVKGKLQGVVVTYLAFNGAAVRSGLRLNDLILEVDRKSVRSVADFYRIVREKKSYLLRVRRSGPTDDIFVVVVLDLKDSK